MVNILCKVIFIGFSFYAKNWDYFDKLTRSLKLGCEGTFGVKLVGFADFEVWFQNMLF